MGASDEAEGFSRGRRRHLDKKERGGDRGGNTGR
jgi:hypothetical protein